MARTLLGTLEVIHWVGKVVLRRSGFALFAKRVMGQRGKKIFFFFAFPCVSERFESIEKHFFFENFVSAKLETCASEVSEMRM